MVKLNKVSVFFLILKERILFLSPSVQNGLEDESCINDFQQL